MSAAATAMAPRSPDSAYLDMVTWKFMTTGNPSVFLGLTLPQLQTIRSNVRCIRIPRHIIERARLPLKLIINNE